MWYIANVCYPTSIIPCSTHASSDSHAAMWSHPLPLPPYLPLQALPMDYSILPSFYFFAGYFELPIYKSWLTGCLFTKTTLHYS